MTVTGRWPDDVTIRSSWSKAKARSWNADVPYGYMRLIRGSSAFLRSAAHQILDYGVEVVASPPLGPGPDAAWVKAGFEPFLALHLYRRSLVGDLPGRPSEVETASPGFDRLHSIDRAAFDEVWRMEPGGLKESFRATPRSTVLVAPGPDDVSGYAIVGVAGITGYLQRIAVDPAAQGLGHGRRLVRGALRWAADHGAATMLLNTQPENEASARLYRDEGFVRIPGDLRVLGYRN